MEAKTITIKPFGKRTDSSGWHMGVLKAFDSETDLKNDNPKYEMRIDKFDTHGDLKIDFEPNGKEIRICASSVRHNALYFDEYVYGPTIKPIYSDSY